MSVHYWLLLHNRTPELSGLTIFITSMSVSQEFSSGLAGHLAGGRFEVAVLEA